MADNTFLQSVLGGAQLAERGLERDLRVQEMAGREAERSLRMEQLRQDMRASALQIEEASNQAARRAKQEAEMELGMAAYQRDISAGLPNDEAAFKNFSGIALRYGKNPLEFAQGALDYRQAQKKGPLELDRLRGDIALQEAQTGAAKALATQRLAADQTTEPETRIGIDPITGEKFTLLRTGPNSWKERDLDSGEELTITSPDGTVVTQRKGGAKAKEAGPVTTATQTAMEQKVFEQQSLARGLSELISGGAEKHFGPGGSLAETFADKLWSNINPKAANPERIQARQKNRELRAVAIRAVMNEKGQTSEGDQRRVNALFPDDGFKGSPAEAKALWEGLLKTTTQRAREAGEMINDPALWTYSLEELRTLPSLFPGKVTLDSLKAEMRRRGVRPAN